VIARRTRISFESPDAGVGVAEEVARIIAPVLGWSRRERRRSVKAYEQYAERELASKDGISS